MQMDSNPGNEQLAEGIHFGEVGDVRQVAGLIFTESNYPPRLQTPIHTHETASFTMVIGGGYVEQFRSGALECSRGTILFRASGEPHYDRISDGGARCLMIELRQNWQQRMLEGGLRISAPRQLNHASNFIAQLRHELLTNDTAMSLAVEALTLELICTFIREPRETRHAPLWLRKLRDRLDVEFAQKISLREIARETGHHPAHVARIFRRHYHCSVGEYVRKRRINLACDRIRHGESLSAIALDAGFANQAHFSRSFRAIMGISPSEYLDLSRTRQTNAHLP